MQVLDLGRRRCGELETSKGGGGGLEDLGGDLMVFRGNEGITRHQHYCEDRFHIQVRSSHLLKHMREWSEFSGLVT